MSSSSGQASAALKKNAQKAETAQKAAAAQKEAAAAQKTAACTTHISFIVPVLQMSYSFSYVQQNHDIGDFIHCTNQPLSTTLSTLVWVHYVPNCFRKALVLHWLLVGLKLKAALETDREATCDTGMGLYLSA